MSLILGIWDGHDSGCALLEGDRVVFAINEERLSRRKLEVGFPARSIQAALDFAGLKPGDIQAVAYSTADPAKTLTRILPALKEEYYLVRRRKRLPGAFTDFKRMAKQGLTRLGPLGLSRSVSDRLVARELGKLGIRPAKLVEVGHHDAHAATAALFSGFPECLVLTLDGIGDGLSGTARLYRGGKFEPLESYGSRESFGLFFEDVTHLLNMRELEDEGKVMAMAACTTPIPDTENPLLDFFRIDGTRLLARHSPETSRRRLREIFWRTSAEQFSFMAQRTLEVHGVSLIRALLERTGMKRLAISGGVASNVKLNMLLRDLEGLEDFYVFPHMGDGGQALGAAAWAAGLENGFQGLRLPDLYLGPSYSPAKIEDALRKAEGIRFARSENVWIEAARLLSQGRILGWCEGRMEYGPRALGARSILALPDSAKIRDDLNLRLKKRSWYQPYCPVMLEEEAGKYLVGGGSKPNRFMTCAYRIKSEAAASLEGVIGPDGTCRPQILNESLDGSRRYFKLLRELRDTRGSGALLNTSFNVHGEPIVCSPEDALKTFLSSSLDALVLDDYLVTKKA